MDSPYFCIEMIIQTIEPDKRIGLIVKNILVYQDDKPGETKLSFFADGYPGIVFQQTETGMRAEPQDKLMPSVFVYGQTIRPVELIMQGRYEMIAFQLYPFVLKSFYNLDAGTLNDSCYDVSEAGSGDVLLRDLLFAAGREERIAVMTEYLYGLFEERRSELDLTIREAIQIFLDSKGQVLVKDIFAKLHLTQRTFERRFLKEVGISAKQFCQIVQFQQSFQQLTSKEYTKLTDVVFSNGYADQSHFIRVFKAFTGTTPRKFSL